MHTKIKKTTVMILLSTPILWANNITDCNVSSSLDTIYQCGNYPKEKKHTFDTKIKKEVKKLVQKKKNLPEEKSIFTSFLTLVDQTKSYFSKKEIKQIEKIKVKKKKRHYGYYKVKRGDIFPQIAKKFSVSTRRLLVLNHLGRDSILKVGQKLKIPLSQRKINAMQRHVAKSTKTKIINRSLRVTATAYSSETGQTDSTPFLAAWNNRLKPGMKIIAVSRDLLDKHGLRNGTKVRISGLTGYYTVRDKMNKRYKKRIDIYKGVNTKSALRWGRRSVVIYY